jgi:predicted permease
MGLSFYRALLRLYPTSFRTEYGPELMRTFEQANRGRGVVGVTFAAIADVVPNAFLAHWGILRQDLHYALRTMNRSRGFVVTVILITAIGVGANTATFSVADFVLLRPLPFPQPNALVRLCEGPKQSTGWGCANELSPANYRDVAATSNRVSAWGAFHGTEVNLVGIGEPARISGAAVSAQVMPIIGVRPMLGRMFDSTTAVDRDGGSVILSYGLWQTQFAGDSSIVGKTIRLDDSPRVIVGVMPPHFQFPTPGVRLWTPLVLADNVFEDRNNSYLQAVGRLAPGTTFEEARTELTVIADRLSREYPETNEATGFSFFRQRDQLAPRARLMLLALCGASLSLLLLTGANLANLLLVRAAGREREVAVRAALGAGRERLVRQLFTESALLALIGGAAGILVAWFTVPLLSHLVPTSLPLAEQPRLDLRALAIAGTITVLTGIGFGLVPALAVGGKNVFGALREGTRGGGGQRHRLRVALVTIEVAVSVVLLVSSGFLIRAVSRVQAVDPGFTPQGILTLRTALTASRGADTVRRVEFYDRVLAGVQSLPGVEAAAYTSGLPMVLTGGMAAVEIPGEELQRDRRANPVSTRYVSPAFFRTLGIPIVRGRGFEDADRAGRPSVAVVSQSFAERYWPNDEPLGKVFRVRGREYSVVGIARDIRVRGLERGSEPQFYGAAAQTGPLGGLYIPKDLVIRVANRANVLSSVRDVIRQVDPEQPISEVRFLDNVIEAQTADRRAQLRVLTALAVVALFLTAIGIHGLLAFMVAQRSREIGVRLALGAEPRRVARMIIGEAARLAVFGVVPGVLVAYGAARAMNALLFGIAPGDPLTLAAGALTVLTVTIAGSLVPAMRAVRVSPLESIRAD